MKRAKLYNLHESWHILTHFFVTRDWRQITLLEHQNGNLYICNQNVEAGSVGIVD
mgnify:FL=1